MIDLPRSLNVNGEIELYLPSSRVVTLPRATPELSRWKGPVAAPDSGGTEAVDVEGRPSTPQLAVLGLFRADGWEGVRIAETRERQDDGPPSTLPAPAAGLLERIHRSAKHAKGDWDLCCWRDDRVVFSLVKRLKGDRFHSAQLLWLEAAFLAGLTHDHFLVVEWIDRQ